MLTAKQKANAILIGTSAKNIASLIETASVITNEFQYRETGKISTYTIPSKYILNMGSYRETIEAYFDFVFDTKTLNNKNYYLAHVGNQITAIVNFEHSGDITVVQGKGDLIGTLWEQLQ